MFSSPNPPTPLAFCTPFSYNNKTSTRPRAVGLPCRATAAAAAAADYYELLSVSGGRAASGEEIKRAYRAMALQYHPDLVCDPLLKEQSTRMFVRLNAAYETLSDPVLRRQYDDSVMGLNRHCHGRRGFELDRAVWQRQILELQRRSALRRDRSAVTSWGGRMQDMNECS